ncbi:hypothetical protein [Shimia biformata]|uniref:hypothetical protein n=1 Tax=Shimia biformata TaxID=1294299 RepID=UPI00195121BE|nr:hypothetical protein [Shimia biformata]
MTTLSAFAPPFMSQLFQMSMRVFPGNRPTSDPVTRDQENMDRARRDFIRDVIETNPDAFTSDIDIQFMMQAYPGKF